MVPVAEVVTKLILLIIIAGSKKPHGAKAHPFRSLLDWDPSAGISSACCAVGADSFIGMTFSADDMQRIFDHYDLVPD